MQNQELEFLAKRSEQFINRQIDAYRNHHVKATSIITVIALFFPLFLFIVEKSAHLIKVLSAIPVVLFVLAIVEMLRVLFTNQLEQGFNSDKLDELVNTKFEDILLFEIGANRASFVANQKVTSRQRRQFNVGLVFTVISVFFSVILLFCNVFIKLPN